MWTLSELYFVPVSLGEGILCAKLVALNRLTYTYTEHIHVDLVFIINKFKHGY